MPSPASFSDGPEYAGHHDVSMPDISMPDIVLETSMPDFSMPDIMEFMPDPEDIVSMMEADQPDVTDL